MGVVYTGSYETDLTDFNTTVVDGGDMSWSASAALDGTSGGVSFYVDDATLIYGQGNLSGTSTTEYRYEFYFDPNGFVLPSSGDYMTIFYLHEAGVLFQQLRYINVSGTNKLRALMKNDAGTWTDTGDYTLSDAPHSIEVHVKKATGVSNNDGFCTVWVDEDFVTPAIDITGVDL